MHLKFSRLGTLVPARPQRPALPDLVLAGGALSLAAAVLFVFAAPVLLGLRQAVTETAIRGNAATVQLAVESWAAANQGTYPHDVHAVLPWLPRSRPPANPVTRRPLEFRAEPGDLTYRCRDDGTGYVIEAWAPDAAGLPRLLLRLEGRTPPPAHAGF
ncbi:MAG: hypothetical protein IH621_07600 [Krumholzibacteria bacterium]|nr:hypothetical protein [Candidatus Krumholzibacteria bacterium]